MEWAKFGWNLEIEISHVPSPKLALPPPHLTDGGGMPFLLFPHGRKIPSRDAKLAEIFKFAERCPLSSQVEMRLAVCPAADFIASFIHHENESSITIFPESTWRGSGSYSSSAPFPLRDMTALSLAVDFSESRSLCFTADLFLIRQ